MKPIRPRNGRLEPVEDEQEQKDEEEKQWYQEREREAEERDEEAAAQREVKAKVMRRIRKPTDAETEERGDRHNNAEERQTAQRAQCRRAHQHTFVTPKSVEQRRERSAEEHSNTDKQ